MDKKSDIVLEYFEKKYGFNIERLGIDKYQINHFFEKNSKFFDKKDTIKLLIIQIEKIIDKQIKDNKKIIKNNFTIEEKVKKNEEANINLLNNNISKKIDKLYIDSKDRDYKLYKFPSNFIFNLNSYVKEVKIKEIILKTTSKEKDSSDNLEEIPYLILDLSSSKKMGSNIHLQSCSCLLTRKEVNGNYRYYEIDENINFTKSINQISVKIKKPDGELYNFGSMNNDFIGSVVLLHLEFLV